MEASGTLCLGLLDWLRYGCIARCVVVIMSAAQHTPGPWEQKIQSCGFWSICTVYGTEQGWVEIHAPNGSHTADIRAESTANARLICASPDLLAELKKARAFIEVDRNDLLASVTANGELKADYIDLRAIAEYNDILASIDAVMTKAEGGAA